MKQGRSHFGVTSIGSKVFFAGGQCNGADISSIEVYDKITGEIEEIGNLSEARLVPIGVTCGSKVIFAGGGSFIQGVFSNVDIYDTLTMEWTVEHLSEARICSGASNGEFAIFGGGLYDSDWNQNPAVWYVTNTVDIYNCQTGEWFVDTLSQARDCRQSTVVGDLAFFAGGMDGPASVSNRVDIYNFKTKEWSIDSLSVARGWTQAASVGNKALFAGGVTNNNLMSSLVDIYDTSTGDWSIGFLDRPRAFANNTCATTIGDSVFFVGGGKFNLNKISWYDSYKTIDIFDNSTNTWSKDNLYELRIEHAVGSTGNQLVVAGGTSCKKTVEIFDFTIGVQDFERLEEIVIYPNPADKILNIRNQSGMVIDEVSIINLIGQNVLIEKGKTDMIDISMLKAGIYTIQIITGGDKYTQTLVIE
jgi:hypothetical protein